MGGMESLSNLDSATNCFHLLTSCDQPRTKTKTIFYHDFDYNLQETKSITASDEDNRTHQAKTEETH